MDAPAPAQQNSSMWFAISLGLMGIIVGYSVAGFNGARGTTGTQVVQNPPTSAPSVPQPPPPSGPMPPVDPAKDYIRGDKNARVTVVTYSDFECPFSKRHHPTLAQIMDTYKNDVNVVYRHFPLGFHQNAQKEAEAAECVGELAGNEAFWTYTDAIYEKTTSNGTGIPVDQLAPMAKALGVNEASFQSCLDSGKYAQKVKDEMNDGAAAGIEGTPGTFIVDNTTKKTTIVSGAQPLDAFKTAIDAILK